MLAAEVRAAELEELLELAAEAEVELSVRAAVEAEPLVLEVLVVVVGSALLLAVVALASSWRVCRRHHRHRRIDFSSAAMA